VVGLQTELGTAEEKHKRLCARLEEMQKHSQFLDEALKARSAEVKELSSVNERLSRAQVIHLCMKLVLWPLTLCLVYTATV
jgi:hypothetical protein